jgi:phage shock protein C
LKLFIIFFVDIIEGEKMNTKKLYRKPNDQMIAGVCAGLADYLNLDLVIVRLIFVLLLIMGGHGLLIYVVLWILMPVQPPYIEGEFKE